MGGYRICTVCKEGGRLDNARDVALIRSNVRRFREEQFTVWRCPHCRSLHSREAVDLTPYYRHYPVQDHTLDFWARAAYGTYLGRLRGAGLSPNQEILDYGCGQGLLLSFLRERGYERSAGYDAHVSSFSDRRVLGKTYDFIIAQDVIEHLEEPGEFLQMMSGTLRRGGILCIGTPNADGINLKTPEKHLLSLHQPYHRHLLSERALIGLASSANFSFISIYHRFYYDTLYPTVNYRFLRSYVFRGGNMLDVAFEPPRVGMVLSSPSLLFYSLFGYFFPPRSEMMAFFTRAR